MPKICYQAKEFRSGSLALIAQANTIITDYQADGYTLTLRQLYYQFVARDLLRNTQQSYSKLGSVINDARLAGLIDWDAIEDRTRGVVALGHWDNPADIIDSAAAGYHINHWSDQPWRVEVWCFPPLTPVITEDGPKPIGAIAIGDRVLTQDHGFQPVEVVHRRKFCGQLRTIHAAGLLPFSCTGEHEIFIIPFDRALPGYKGNRRRFLKPGFFASRSVGRFDMLAMPRLQGIKRIDSVLMKGGNRSKEVGWVNFSGLLQEVIGLYLAEGCVMLDQRTTQFTFGRHEQAHADRVIALAEELGLSHHAYLGRGTIVVYVFGKALASWLRDNFGCGAYLKRLPSWCWFLPYADQLRVLQWHFRGDGHHADVSRSAVTVSTRSQVLAQQEQIILGRIGYGAALDVRPDHDEPMFRVSIAGEFGVNLAKAWDLKLPPRLRRYNHIIADDKYIYFPIRRVETQSWNGDVCNLRVKRDHTYCVPVVVHNCEKEALAGVFDRTCNQLDVPFLACRGYVSQSEMWRAARRLTRYEKRGQKTIILHFGDHDPSGIDMTRDIRDRLALFGAQTEIQRLALNHEQIEKYSPPPNPAKATDSRFEAYQAEFGDESWELDALEPRVLTQLVQDGVRAHRDEARYEAARQREQQDKDLLRRVVNR